ncbi:MAG: hypothetical protein WBL67_09105 [Nitrososphaeraceae archaeon]
MISTITNVYASGARLDYDAKYVPIQSAPECWKDGYDDGQNNPFGEDRHEECKFNVGSQYYDGS